MKKLATDKRRFTRPCQKPDRQGGHRQRNVPLLTRGLLTLIPVHLWLGLVLCFCVCLGIIVSSRAQQKPAARPPLEGCLKCHDKIEPMHRYGPTVAGALDKLDNG